ncbi:ribonuclease P protein component [Candidatus Daviesbacteria bacterium]|nr:ribonuclease P protein component [Candidatus Daviesbacteria bacterium]
MLPKQKRLNLKKDFKWVAEGKSASSKSFKLFYRAGENRLPRIGIALSTKYFKKAHDRNRAKRLMSQAFCDTNHKLQNNLNIVALPNWRVFEVKSDSLKKELEGLLGKEGLINEKDNAGAN